jgi:hypothetical protein
VTGVRDGWFCFFGARARVNETLWGVARTRYLLHPDLFAQRLVLSRADIACGFFVQM